MSSVCPLKVRRLPIARKRSGKLGAEIAPIFATHVQTDALFEGVARAALLSLIELDNRRPASLNTSGRFKAPQTNCVYVDDESKKLGGEAKYFYFSY